MTINSISPNQSATLYSKPTSMENVSTKERVFSMDEKEVNAQDSNAIQKDTSTIYEELASKYNVRSATFEELTQISEALYNAGMISLGEHGILTFDYERATNAIKRHAPTPVLSNFSMYETKANNNHARDWITEYEARIAKDFKYGNLIGYQTNTKILNILQQISAV